MGRIRGKVIVITGASSGIGEEAARQLARAGATVCLVARRAEELERVAASIRGAGGTAHVHPADLTAPAEVDACCDALLAAHPRIDVLVNNAGRSIRRAIRESLDRRHDYERTMQLNFHAPVQITLRLLERLLASRGQVINVSSVGVLMSPPRFSAYVASKSALDAFSRSLRVELEPEGLAVTTLNYPLVRTPMVEPTAIYRYLPALDATEAAGWITDAVRKRPARRTTLLALGFSVATAVLPGPALAVISRFYRARFEKLKRKLEAEAASEG